MEYLQHNRLQFRRSIPSRWTTEGNLKGTVPCRVLKEGLIHIEISVSSEIHDRNLIQ